MTLRISKAKRENAVLKVIENTWRRVIQSKLKTESIRLLAEWSPRELQRATIRNYFMAKRLAPRPGLEPGTLRLTEE
jgi:hypothetical protein